MRSTFRVGVILPIALAVASAAAAQGPPDTIGRREFRSPPGWYGPGPGWHHWSDRGPGYGWSYYGVDTGPYIGLPPSRVWPGVWPGSLWGPPSAIGSMWTNGLSLYGPPVPTYGPVPGSFAGSDASKRFFTNPPPVNAVWVGLGWGGYRSPSPRCKVPNVSVHPSSVSVVEAPLAVTSEGAPCLKLVVRVPNDTADLWIEQTETKLRGMERTFESPPLEAGKAYKYEFVAKWIENGVQKAESRTATGTAGQTISIDFTKPTDVAVR